MIAVAFVLLFNFISASGTLFRWQVFEKFDYVFNHFLQLLFVIVLYGINTVYYNSFDPSTLNRDYFQKFR